MDDRFSEDEIMLLKMAFKSLDETVEVMRYHNYCSVDLCNTLFNLGEKLGISDIL